MATMKKTDVKKRGKIGYSQYWQSELYEEVMNTYRAIDDTVDSIGRIINEMQTQTGRNWDTEPDVPKWFVDVLDTLDRARRELYYATINKSAKKSAEVKTKIRKENVTEIEVNGEPYFIWESFNGFKGSKENPDQYITNARAVLDFNRNDGFESIQDVIDYINQYFVKSTKKSKHGTFTRIASDLRNLSAVEEESLTESLNDYGVNTDISTLTMAFNMADAYTTHREEELDRRYNGDESYHSSAKKSRSMKNTGVEMSFEDNVNKMRQHNHDRIWGKK